MSLQRDQNEARRGTAATSQSSRDMDLEAKSQNFKQQSARASTISLLVVGLAVLAATFRTTLFHNTHSLWSASGDTITRQWERFYDYFQGDMISMGLALYGISLLHHWLFGGVFLVWDLTGSPSFITKYKVQPDQTTIPLPRLLKCLLTIVTNQTIFALPMLIGLYNAMRWRGCGTTPAQIPTFQMVALELVVFSLVEEIGFYYSHRLLHYPALYKTVHKMHHEWTASFSIVAFYCHPLEHFLANVLPAVLGPVLMRSHILTLSAWLVIAQTSSMISHSGYHLPFLPSPEFHDFHHLKFTSNYGVLGILDRLHGTDAKFNKTRQFQRHFTLLGFTPAAEIIPDDVKTKTSH